MNWKLFDAIRRQSGPLQVDLMEAYQAKKITRRDFVRRGTILGVGAPVMGAVIAACGSGETADTSTETDTDTSTDEGGSETAAATVAGGSVTVGIQEGNELDPVNMLDLGTYSVCSSSFEYLVGLADDRSGNIGTGGLAQSWEPNEDGSAWTFSLREGVMWHDGELLTAADVVGTINRMVEVGAGLAGVVAEGGAEAVDDQTVTVNLEGPNGNFPVLVSIYNPQSLITPADYTAGTLLDERPAGTGPWIFDSFDPASYIVNFVANENYWGGRPNLDSISLQGFADPGNRVAAMAAGEIDIIQEFGAVDGASLLADDSFSLLQPPSANHRQVYFNTQLPADGPFTNNLVRQAIGWCIDRQEVVDAVYGGFGVIGNDHPVHPTLPFFDEAAVEQRTRDIPRAMALLEEAGYPDGIEGVIQAGEITFSGDLASVISQNCAEAGINLEVNVTDNNAFYGEFWCVGNEGPGLPCGGSSAMGIVDWGHRPTPDIFFGRALQTDGDWNGSNYASSEFDELFTDYQAAADVEAQTAATTAIIQHLHEDVPAVYPAFFDYLGGHSSNVTDVEITALGHVRLETASRTAE